MNGWAFAAVAAVCVTVLLIALLRAMVAIGRQQKPVDAASTELSADEEFVALQAHNRAGQAELRRQIAEAAERARRERDGEF